MGNDDKQAQFLPFNAINNFMRNDYRETVVRTTLSRMNSLDGKYRDQINSFTRKLVKVPGFRNSSKAPISVRVKPTCDSFEKSADMTAAILSAWSEIHSELRSQVFQMLDDKEWEVLPTETDRTKLPGFFPKWPKGENFEDITEEFSKRYPEMKTSSDDLSLMVVWLSLCLPYLDDPHDPQPE